MKQWLVLERRPLEVRARKVSIFRYTVIAETPEEAVQIVKDDHGSTRASKWSARPIDGSLCWGCELHEPTPEEKKEQRAKGWTP